MTMELHHLNTHGMMEQAGDVLDGVVRLKQRIAELEAERDAFEKSFNEMTESYIKSQRVLWLARAERAKDRTITCDDFAYLGDTERNISMTLARTWMKCRLLKPSEWSKVWEKVERKCRTKSEEYK